MTAYADGRLVLHASDTDRAFLGSDPDHHVSGTQSIQAASPAFLRMYCRRKPCPPNAITVKDVTKVYRLYDKPIDRLKESLSPTHKKLSQRLLRLKMVCPSNVEKGQTVGNIGTNGSGKSTILKIITGVLTPTTGQVDVEGKISALLELGAGFQHGLTPGIENIYMNGTMMGYSRKEMDEKLQDILDFADIGDFGLSAGEDILQCGMFVRLAFALNINVEPEILIVDEAPVRSEMYSFQAKCYRKMEEIKQRGTTIPHGYRR